MKEGSLIGISDFTIPNSLLSSKEEKFIKVCGVTMTDSTKRVLFGSVTTTKAIKLNIVATITYSEKPMNLKQSHSLPKTNVKSIVSPKGKVLKNKYACDTNDIVTKTPPMLTFKKQLVSVGNQKLKSGSKSTNISKITASAGQSKKNSKPINNVHKKTSSKLNSSSKQPELIEPDVDPNIDPKDTSVIDEIVLKEIGQIDEEFNSFQSKILEENNLNELKNIKDTDALLNKTKEVIGELFNYQTLFYERFKDSLSMKNRIKELLIKYNEKYRSILKKQHRLEEQEESHNIRTKIIVNIHRNESKQIQDMLPIKKAELELYKKIYNLSYNDKDIRKYYSDLERRTKEAEDENQNLLLKILKGVIAKHGPLTKIMNNNNSSQVEISNLNNVISKYKLPNDENMKINEEEEEENEMENNVITSSPDETDMKLNKYLNMFYAKRNTPKIPFIKTSTNNYEYGSQKVLVKIEGDTIRLRVNGGYILLDRFLELNAPIEEIKMRTGSKAKSSGVKVGIKKGKGKK